MQPEKNQIDKAIVLLNAKLLGIVIGFLSGSGLFLMTIILVLKKGQNVGQHLGLLRNFFPGYSVSLAGSFVGFLYAFALGFLVGVIIGAVYNKVARA